MKHDARGLELSTDSTEAAAQFDRAVEHYLKYHVDTMNLVNDALVADPQFVMGHCMKAYLMLAGANPAHRAAIAASLGAALATTRFVSSFLYGVDSNDPWTLSLASGVLALVAGVAGFLPARRASRLDPMSALREE